MVGAGARLRRFLLESPTDDASGLARRALALEYAASDFTAEEWDDTVAVIDGVRAMERQGVPPRAAYLQIGALQTL